MLKAVLENMDGLDEAVQSLYTKNDDGVFVLQIDGINQHPEVLNLKTAHERAKEDRKAFMDERDALSHKYKGIPDDFDLNEWKGRNDKPDLDDAAKQQLVALRQSLEAERDEALAKVETVESEYKGKLNKFALERDLSSALTEAGITNPSFVKGATAMLSPLVKMDDGGKAIVETDMGNIPLQDHIKKWVGSDDGGKAFVSSPKGGNQNGNDVALGGSNKPRDQMSAVEKSNYINEHGQEAYLSLPKSKQG